MSVLSRLERSALAAIVRADGARRNRGIRRLGGGAELRARDALARGPGVDRLLRHRAARRALRPRRDRDDAVDARQPARAVRRHLRAAEGRDGRRPDGADRVDLRQRAAGARAGARGRLPPRAGRDHALLGQAAERHRDAAAGDGVHHRAARPLARRARPGQPPRRHDLGGRRRVPADRLRHLGGPLPARRPGSRRAGRGTPRTAPASAAPQEPRGAARAAPVAAVHADAADPRRRGAPRSSRTGSSTPSSPRSCSCTSPRPSRGS